MAFKVEKIISPKCHPHNLATKGYVCDGPDDIAKLPRFKIEGTQSIDPECDIFDNEPCNYGSVATVISPFTGYKLAPSNEWKPIF